MKYSLNGGYPSDLPNRIRMPDGSTRTDSSTFTEEEIAAAGYTSVNSVPTYDAETQKVEWNSDTVDWEIINLTVEEISQKFVMKWTNIRAERDRALEKSDHLILKYYELGEPVPQTLVEYRQALRDLPQTYATISDIVWPTMPTDDPGTN